MTVTPPVAPGAAAQVITKETTVIQTVAGKTIVQKAKPSRKAKKAACMRKARAKKGSARRKAIRRCSRRY